MKEDGERSEPFPKQSKVLTTLRKKSFENIKETGKKILVTIIFSLSHNVSYLFRDNSSHLNQAFFVVCKFFSFGFA